MATALEGIRILDLAHLPPGSFCTMILGDLGAEVIKIVPSNTPVIPPVPCDGNKWLLYDAHMRNKKNMMLNLRNDDARQVFYKLVAEADVVIEGFRPGVVKRLGVDYETVKKINKRIVYCSLSGFGQDGPYNQMAGHDINYISISGVLGVIGDSNGQPIVPSNLVGDFAGASLHGVIGILAALMAREKTGQGQHVDISYTDGVLSLMTWEASAYFATGLIPERGNALLTGAVPWYNTYKTKDNKYISIGSVEPHFWQNLCQEVGRPDFAPHQFNAEKYPEIFDHFRKTFLTKDRDEWFDLLKDKNICVAPVYDINEVFTNPQVLHRQMLVEIDHPEFGKVKQVGIPVKLSETPGQIKNLGTTLDAHTDMVLHSLGYTEDEIQKLRQSGAIG